MSDELTLIAGVHQQNAEILAELRSLRAAIAQFQGTQVAPDDVWVIGFERLQLALRERGLEVSEVKLKRFRSRDVFRQSEEIDLECRNVGTPNLPRWRFHVGNCKAAIARFEKLPVTEQRRLLGL